MIDLTPLEVRKKKGDFRRIMRGYDPATVDDFIDLVADRLEELVRDNMSLSERLSKQDQQVAEYRERERALTDALVSAQEMREEIRRQTTRDAELAKQASEQETSHLRRTVEEETARLRSEAEQQAARVRDAAQREADALRVSARGEADQILQAARRERAQHEEALQRVQSMQRKLLESYRSLLGRELEDLDRIARSVAALDEEVAGVLPDSAEASAAAGSGDGFDIVAALEERPAAPPLDLTPVDEAPSPARQAETFEAAPFESQPFEPEPFEPEPFEPEPFEPEPFEPEQLEPESLDLEPLELDAGTVLPPEGDLLGAAALSAEAGSGPADSEVGSEEDEDLAAEAIESLGSILGSLGLDAPPVEIESPTAVDAGAEMELYDRLAPENPDDGVPGPIGLSGISLLDEGEEIDLTRKHEPRPTADGVQDGFSHERGVVPVTPPPSEPEPESAFSFAADTDDDAGRDVEGTGTVDEDSADDEDDEMARLLRNAAAAGYSVPEEDELLLSDAVEDDGEDDDGDDPWLPSLLEEEDR